MGHLRASPVVATLLFLVAALPAAGRQETQGWEDKIVDEVVPPSTVRSQRWAALKNRLNLRRGKAYTLAQWKQDIQELWKTGYFEKVEITPRPSAANPNRLSVTVELSEYPVVEVVDIVGVSSLDARELRDSLRIAPGDVLDPARLKQDQEELREKYLQEGYHFSSVEPEKVPTETGVVLKWHVSEGPHVTVSSIRFTGNTVPGEGELEERMLTKENSSLLFLPTKRNPFVLRTLLQDLERIKLYYRAKGWLDILEGDRVYIEDLRFNRDKTRAFIKIHIDEGPRYTVRSIRFEGVTGDVFTEEELRDTLHIQPGDPYDEEVVLRDYTHIRRKYGQRAYIMAEVSPQQILPLEGTELDLVFEIIENRKQYVGRILISGNTKTRDDVLRRQFTRRGFVPGAEYNQTSFDHGVKAIRDRGWVDLQSPGGGVDSRHDPGDLPDTRDVTVNVTEGETGLLRFAAGFSSAYGLLGMVELTQRNFDIGDLPRSLEEVFNGNGFAGGGQILQIRAAPAVKRQLYSLHFVEPYFFGYELEYAMSGRRITYVRESWDEDANRGSVAFIKRFWPLSIGVEFEAGRIEYTDVEPDAPLAVLDLAEQKNYFYTLTPSIVYDNRDSIMMPTEGFHIRLAMDYTGQILPGDFDFNRYFADTDFFFPIYETKDQWRHVLALQFRFGWVDPERQNDDVPISERFFLGGPGSMRGFDFRGIGPMENGDPVGGEAMIFASAEYLFPLFTQVLRGAFFFDAGTLEPTIDDLHDTNFRYAVGFGVRFIVPQLGNVPFSLDFAWPLWKDDEDDRRTVTFNIGRLF